MLSVGFTSVHGGRTDVRRLRRHAQSGTIPSLTRADIPPFFVIDLKCYDGLGRASMNWREFICVLGISLGDFGLAAAPSSPRWPRWRFCRSRPAMPAGCRMSSKARQSKANRKTKQAVEARRFAQARRFGEACRLGKAPHRKARRPGAGRLEPCRLETGRDPL